MLDNKEDTIPLQSFDEIINWKKIDDNTWSGKINNSWMQGRSAFGGIPTGVALKVLREQCCFINESGLDIRFVSTKRA